jgi:hypothetical protein
LLVVLLGGSSVARVDDILEAALKALPPKPPDDAPQADKKRYSELVSNAVAPAFAAELRHRGLSGARPDEPGGSAGTSGAERRMAGGIGAKKVDVTWATEESGLLLGLSVKSINFRDIRRKKRSDGTVEVKEGSFQKNLVNRRGEMLYEAVTLHRRFPYAVLGGFLFLDKDAALDGTERRNSTYENAHIKFSMFDGRDDPAGRDEQYEQLYIVLLDATPFGAKWQTYRVGDLEHELPLSEVFDAILLAISERNPDFYEVTPQGSLRKLPQ